jgi:hypothetical protein
VSVAVPSHTLFCDEISPPLLVRDAMLRDLGCSTTYSRLFLTGTMLFEMAVALVSSCSPSPFERAQETLVGFDRIEMISAVTHDKFLLFGMGVVVNSQYVPRRIAVLYASADIRRFTFIDIFSLCASFLLLFVVSDSPTASSNPLWFLNGPAISRSWSFF